MNNACRVIDFHCDTILGLMNHSGSGLYKNDFNIDIEKLVKGNYMAQFFAMFIDIKGHDDPHQACLDMADRFYMELEENKKFIKYAGNLYDMKENDSEGKISAFLTIEEGGALKGKISNLRNFYRLGVRLVTLTWNYPNEIGYPNHNWEYSDRGLTPFGEEVVHEMNRLGMAVDVSHLSDGGFYDVARFSSAPFIASHSNARAVKNHSRNLTDDMIKILAEKGGIMGINFAREFLGDQDISMVEDMVRHIKHIRNVGGLDVIALGTDFDGISPYLEIRNAGEMGKLILELQKQDFSEDEIEKILYKNAIRFIGDVLR